MHPGLFLVKKKQMVGVTLTTPSYCLVLNSTLVPRKYHMSVELSTFQQRSPSFCQQVQHQESLPLSHRAHGSMWVPAHLCPQRYHNAAVFPVALVRYRSCISVHPGSCAWSRSASVPRIKRTLHHPEYSECSMGWEEECEEKKMGKPWSWSRERRGGGMRHNLCLFSSAVLVSAGKELPAHLTEASDVWPSSFPSNSPCPSLLRIDVLGRWMVMTVVHLLCVYVRREENGAVIQRWRLSSALLHLCVYQDSSVLDGLIPPYYKKRMLFYCTCMWTTHFHIGTW